MSCPYCGKVNEIETKTEPVEELNFEEFLKKASEEEETEEKITVKCETCGAQTELEANVTASACAFCDSKIVAQGQSTKAIKPRSLLPFKIEKKEAQKNFKEWISGLWFAPTKLKAIAGGQGLDGIYSPYWTYDTATTTEYTGQRGEHYYETETYTEDDDDGNSVTKTRQVQKTRWYGAYGTVFNDFDDLLVLGSESLPREQTRELEPWDLENLVSYDPSYLSGFKVESYTVDLAKGFNVAKDLMEDDLEESIRRDIGGDEQRISSKTVHYRSISFKHILLPVWLSAYRYNSKVFRFVINARTGEVQGERPWSVMKIATTVIAVLGAIGSIYYVMQ